MKEVVHYDNTMISFGYVRTAPNYKMAGKRPVQGVSFKAQSINYYLAIVTIVRRNLESSSFICAWTLPLPPRHISHFYATFVLSWLLLKSTSIQVTKILVISPYISIIRYVVMNKIYFYGKPLNYMARKYLIIIVV